MNPSFLAALAGGLRGGMQGYNSAKAGQRQEALDALQRQKIEQDDLLKEAALKAKMASDEARQKAEAENIDLKRQGARDAEQNRIRDTWGKGWDPKAEGVPQERAQYFGLGEDFLKARPGPDVPKDQYGVYADPGVDEWNNLPQESQTQGYVRAKGDDILRTVAEKQAALRNEKQKNALEQITTKGTLPPKERPPERIKPGVTAKDLTDFKNQLGNLQGIYDLAKRTRNANLGKFNSLLDDADTLTNSMDPDVAELRQALQKNLADYMKMISGAAVSDPEVKRLAQVQPTPKDSLRVLLRKTAALAKAMSRNYANTLETLDQAEVSTGRLPKSLDSNWADEQWGGGAPAAPMGAGPSARPVNRRNPGF